MTDLTRLGKNSEKKTVSIAAAVIDAKDVVGTSVHDLFVLPERCLVTRAYLVNEIGGQTGLTADVGFEGAAKALFDAADMDGTPATIASTTALHATGTGKKVQAKFSAQPTAGRFVVIVEYVEYLLGNGNLMNLA